MSREHFVSFEEKPRLVCASGVVFFFFSEGCLTLYLRTEREAHFDRKARITKAM